MVGESQIALPPTKLPLASKLWVLARAWTWGTPHRGAAGTTEPESSLTWRGAETPAPRTVRLGRQWPWGCWAVKEEPGVLRSLVVDAGKDIGDPERPLDQCRGRRGTVAKRTGQDFQGRCPEPQTSCRIWRRSLPPPSLLLAG